MSGDGKKAIAAAAYSFQRAGGNNVSQRVEAETGFMETLGRGFSELYRSTSEEMILRSLMENPMEISSAPSLEMLGFKNIPQTTRGDSEELFSTWLMNREIPGFTSQSLSYRSRQVPRKLSTDLAVSNPQSGVVLQKRNSNENVYQQNLCTVEEHSNDSNNLSLRNTAEKGMQSDNLYSAKPWLNSSQPITRSRSSELRRRYAAMQSSYEPVAPSPNNTRLDGTAKAEPGFGNCRSFYDIPMDETSSHQQTFASPSNSSSSHFNTSPITNADTLSSVVSMLKGTLMERKKLVNQSDKEGTPFHFFNPLEVPSNINCNQDPVNQIMELHRTFHGLSPIQLKDSGNLSAAVERSVELNIENYVTPTNQAQLGTASQEPSQSESSAAAPVVSTGVEACDGPAHSGQAQSACESSRKYIGSGASENDSNARDYREKMCEGSLKNGCKKGSLVRMGSVTSACSVDRDDPTKKRRVERSRKMAEAKERNSTPQIPSDMQSVLKRCETLEKEVRSLKLNLSFMNRKDSEQTKQIEELHKQNEILGEEKERLLEEIERMISETGKI